MASGPLQALRIVAGGLGGWNGGVTQLQQTVLPLLKKLLNT